MNLKDLINLVRLYPPVWQFSGCQWMFGRRWERINKELEISLWNDGSLRLIISEEYPTAPEAIADFGEFDTRSIFYWELPTPFKKASDRS